MSTWMKWCLAATVVVVTLACVSSRPAEAHGRRGLWWVFPPPPPGTQTVFNSPSGQVVINQTLGFMVGPRPIGVRPLYGPSFYSGGLQQFYGGPYGGFSTLPYGGYYWRPY